MKAFLLAAGEGRRLRPLTDSLPKCLVPIKGTPLLEIWLNLLAAHGITHVLVNLHHLPEHVTSFLRTFAAKSRVETVHEPQLAGSAGTVWRNRDFVAGEKDFLVVYGDNLTNVDLTKMMAFHRKRSETLTLGVTQTDRPTEKGTVVLGPVGEVVAFEEKAAHPRSNLANAGIYVANPRLFDYMGRSEGVLDFGHDVLPRMVPDVAAYFIEEFLMDIGTPAAYERAQHEWPAVSGIRARD